MRWWVYVLVVLIAGAILGPISAGNAGYLLINFAGYTIESTVIGLVVFLIIAILALSLVIAAIKALLGKTRAGGQWFSRRKARKLKQREKRALLAMLKHDYTSALVDFELLYKQQRSENLAALLAFTANKAGEPGKAKYWLDTAGSDFEPASEFLAVHSAVQRNDDHQGLTIQQVETQLDRGEFPPHLWTQAIELYKGEKRLDDLQPHLNQIREQSQLTQVDFDQLVLSVYLQHFIRIARNDAKALFKDWKSLSRTQRSTPAIRLAYAKALNYYGQHSACTKVVKNGLERGELNLNDCVNEHVLVGTDPNIIDWVQSHLKRKPNDSQYIRALAVLALGNKDYSLAQRALKKLSDLNACNKDDYIRMGDAYAALGDIRLAANAYKQALTAKAS